MTQRDRSLEGKVAIVTGSKQGIGKAIAFAFAEAGAGVVVATRNVEGGALEAVAQEIRQKGGKALAVQVDVRRKSDVDSLIAQTTDEFGRLDILVNNAGLMHIVPLVDQSEEDWDLTIATDLKGYFLCAQAAARVMIPQRHGTIINVTSIRAIRPRMHLGAYSVAKAGQNMLTKSLALELAEYGIRVNAVAPSMVETEMTREMLARPGFMESFMPQIPLGRMGYGEDMAGAALFLASEASNYITGQVIYVDGGQLI